MTLQGVADLSVLFSVSVTDRPASKIYGSLGLSELD